VQQRLRLTRRQILAFRRQVGALEARMPPGPESLRRAAWAGLQDSMPRAALLSLYARVEGVGPVALEDPSLAQLWGPRYQTYVVPMRDFPLFSLGRLPDGQGSRAGRGPGPPHARPARGRSDDGSRPRSCARPRKRDAVRRDDGHGGDPLGGCTCAARLDGSRPGRRTRRCLPRARSALPACLRPDNGRRFARWAGISRRSAADAFASLEGSLLPVRTPLGDESLLAEDEAAMRAAETAAAPARLLPSGDSYFLLDGAERTLLVPRPEQRERLWTSRVWPGALLVEGEIRGTWRRAGHTVRVEAWGRLPRRSRDAVEAEAAGLPLPGVERPIEVVWAATSA
jgi:hypothetical protein